MNPKATIYMENGAKIVIELLPEYAPNTVNSFIHCVKNGCMDGKPIQRIVAGKWVDFTYTAWKSDVCKYLIPRESRLNPDLPVLDSHPGCVCMGGYGDMGNASCEPFFPLKDCPEHKGIYPVFGKVIEGMDEIYRLAELETVPVRTAYDDYIVDTPKAPQIIKKAELELYGVEYPRPVKMPENRIPKTWE